MHTDRHPTYQEGCWLCKMRSVSVSAVATPTRKPVLVEQLTRDKRTKADCAAYRRLVKGGLDNFKVEGSAHREATL